MSETLKKLRIFAASPSDVANERAKLETVVDSLKPMADYLGLTLEVIDWRSVVPDAGRPQQVIFDQLQPTSWDIFIGILWHRFGTPPGAKDKDGKDFLSGTEEEFKTACELWKQHGKPRMVLYRCTRALPFDVDPDQLKNVRAFFKLIEDVKGDYPTLYQAFDTTESFEKLALNNLQKLLVEYGEESKTPITPEVEQVLAPKIPNNLPRRQAFFGRTKEMETAMRALSPDDRTWGVLVDGIGGIGKSAIAIEAAYRAQEAGLFDAFIFVTAKTNILEPSGIKELNPPARTLDEFLNETARILGQFGIAKLTGDEKRRALIDVLRSMHTLLIYDNLETLSKEEQEDIADFLRELPKGCKAIITSRRRGGEGGVWLRVEKLDWEAARSIIENQMSLDERLADKLNYVGEFRWQDLYDKTNGSPLALVHILGLMRVRTTLTFDGALEMLGGNRDIGLQEFIFQEAGKELTLNDKIALCALSFFQPSATFDAWMQVSNLSRNILETTIDFLSTLSLVDVLAGEERYALHPLTRIFAQDLLLLDTKLEYEIGLNFVQYWANYSKRYGGGDLEVHQVYDRLETEWNNLEAAANWLWERYTIKDGITIHDEIHGISELTNSLRQFLPFGGRWDGWVQSNARAYQASCALNDWSKAGWYAHEVASIYYTRALIDKAARWADRCAKAWERGGSMREQAAGTRMQGLIARQTKDYDKAKRLYEDALSKLRELGLDEDVAVALNALGTLAQEQENYIESERYFSEALELARKIENKEYQATYIGKLGLLSLHRQQWTDAHEWFNLELALAQTIGRMEFIAQSQYGLACVHETQGRKDLALPLAQDAIKIYERLQHRDLTLARELLERLKQ